ncbi:MAG: 2,3,4,5-tetrahydropyridine-2,6-dicarboxylate N-succinyltransferase, partial [Ilumatobacter sp.]|nr:2,3,4,5-tetrahydropyridine-2,6-dicarboxylate N-succinyltransferase [Ilumatobacter sp.]
MTAAWGRGLATITNDGTVLDTWFRELGLGEEPDPEQFEAYTVADRTDDVRQVRVKAVQVHIDTD